MLEFRILKNINLLNRKELVAGVVSEEENYNSLRLHEFPYSGLEIEGLDPVIMDVFTTSCVGMDGSVYVGSKLESRILNIGFFIETDVKSYRNEILNYCSKSEKIPMRIIVHEDENNIIDVIIEGYVENLKFDRYTNKQYVTMTIVCPNPYFYDSKIERKNLTLHEDGKYRTGLFYNYCAWDIPINLEVNVHKSWQEIVVSSNKGIFRVDAKELQVGSGVLNINTKKGEKSVSFHHEKGTDNIINMVDGISGDTKIEWPMITSEANQIVVNVIPSNSLNTVKIFYCNEHRGI